MIAFIDDHRCVYGVGPICRVLGIAPSTYHAFKAVERNPDLASDRARQDRLDMAAIKQAFDGSRLIAGVGQRGPAKRRGFPVGAGARDVTPMRDARETTPAGLRARDLYIRDLHLDAIKVKGRDFR